MNIEAILNEQNLTTYGAAQMIGAETDEQLKTVWAVLNRWKDGKPPRYAVMARYLGILGYDICVVKRTGKPLTLSTKS